MSLTYKKAGVSIDAGNALVEMIKPLARKTSIPGVVAGLGGFGGLFDLGQAGYRHPVLVSGTDGVGTKLKVAFEAGIFDTVGIDLVAMNVNDVVTCGAKPLFFLDYFATGALDPQSAAKVIEGIAEGCLRAGCALLGGETAELPGFYQPGEFEVAGFAVGVVEKDDIIDGSAVEQGDVVLGLFSSGLHSNGYSLARRVVFDVAGLSVHDPFPGDPDMSVGQALLTPTIIYVKPLLSLMGQVSVKAVAHITGGGLLENPPRVLPDHLAINFDRDSFEIPPLFTWLAQAGDIAWPEMFRVFNCGIGMTVIVPADQADRALRILAGSGTPASVIGQVVKRTGEAVTGLW